MEMAEPFVCAIPFRGTGFSLSKIFEMEGREKEGKISTWRVLFME